MINFVSYLYYPDRFRISYNAMHKRFFRVSDDDEKERRYFVRGFPNMEDFILNRLMYNALVDVDFDYASWLADTFGVSVVGNVHPECHVGVEDATESILDYIVTVIQVPVGDEEELENVTSITRFVLHHRTFSTESEEAIRWLSSLHDVDEELRDLDYFGIPMLKVLMMTKGSRVPDRDDNDDDIEWSDYVCA